MSPLLFTTTFLMETIKLVTLLFGCAVWFLILAKVTEKTCVAYLVWRMHRVARKRRAAAEQRRTARLHATAPVS